MNLTGEVFRQIEQHPGAPFLNNTPGWRAAQECVTRAYSQETKPSLSSGTLKHAPPAGVKTGNR